MVVSRDERGDYVCKYTSKEITNIIKSKTANVSVDFLIINDAFSNVVNSYPELSQLCPKKKELLAGLYTCEDGGAVVRFVEEDSYNVNSLEQDFSLPNLVDVMRSIFDNIFEEIRDLSPYVDNKITQGEILLSVSSLDAMIECGDFIRNNCRYKVKDDLYKFKQQLYWVLSVEPQYMSNLVTLIGEQIGVDIERRRNLIPFLKEHSNEFRLCSNYISRA